MLEDRNHIGPMPALFNSRPEGLPYEPETIAISNQLGYSISPALTPYGISGEDWWTNLDLMIVTWKNIFSLPLGVMSLQNRFPFLYPAFGTTAAHQALNLSNVSTYLGSFFGGYTHDLLGCLPGGVNSYLSPGIAPNALPQNDACWIKDIKTNVAGNFADYGAVGSPTGNVIMYAQSGASIITRHNIPANQSSANASTNAMFIMSRQQAAEYPIYKEGVLVATVSVASGTPNSFDMVFDAVNNGGPIIQYSPRRWIFAGCGLGMSQPEAAAFTSAWRTFNVLIGR